MAEPLSPATQALGERVRARREVLRFNQEALAHRAGPGTPATGGRVPNVAVHNLSPDLGLQIKAIWLAILRSPSIRMEMLLLLGSAARQPRL